MRLITKFLLLLITASTVHAEGDYHTLPLSDTDCESSAIIAGCVNAITGSYTDYEVDLVLPGIKPLVFSRSNHSNDRVTCRLGGSWRDSFHSFLTSRRHVENQIDTKYRQINYFEPTGACTAYHAPNHDGPNRYEYRYELRQNAGASNAGRSEISGRTNFFNTQFFAQSWGAPSISMTSGAGEKRQFLQTKSGNDYWYYLKSERDSSGYLSSYTYDSHFKMTHVTFYNPEETGILGSFELPKKNLQEIQWNPYDTVTASDGRVVTYKYKITKFKEDKKTWYNKEITEVIRPNGTRQTYDYYQKNKTLKSLITRKNNPDKRALEIEYINEQDISTKNLYKRNALLYRTKRLKAPVGMNADTITTHRFSYHIDKVIEGTWDTKHSGSTEVFDALNRKKVFQYNENSLLTAIETYRGTKQHFIHSTLRNIWIEGGPLHGAIQSQALYDGQSCLHYSKNFTYDNRGNITAEEYQGNLTGSGYDSYTIHRTFSEDGYNTKLSEQDFRKTDIYRYITNSDVLAIHLQCDKKGIRQREFFTYDENRALTQKIEDDGSSFDENDLRGVTERRITRIVPKKQAPCVGFPLEIEELYLDIDSQSEVSLKKTYNTYTKEGWKTKEEVFDGERNFCYQKEWAYNAMGQVIKEINEVGYITLRDYDANGNLIYEYGPKPGHEKTYTYDFANRLIRISETYNGETLTTKHTYDYVGNRTSTEDASGNITYFTYNDLNQLVTITKPSGSVIKKEYDFLGHLSAQIEADEAATIQTNNARGQPTKIIYPDGTEEHFQYSLDGLLTQKSEKNRSYTTFTYDYQKRPIAVETYNSDGTFLRAESKKYSAFRLLSETDYAGNTTYFTYDGAGRKVCEKNGDQIITYQHDSCDRVIAKNRNNLSVKAFSYDAMGRVSEERIEDIDGKIYQKIGYAYDEYSNKTHTYTYQDDYTFVTTTEYNAQNLPTRVIDAEGNITTTTYTHCHNLKTVTIDPLGRVVEVMSDEEGKERKKIHKNSLGETLSEIETTYDDVGNPISDTHKVYHGIQYVRTVTNSREFDRCNRIVKLIEGEGTVEQKITHTTYNEKGELHTISKHDGVILHHTYDTLGRLQSLSSSDKTIFYTYEYDLNNHPILIVDREGSKNIRKYDRYNRLIYEKLSNDLTLSYCYDKLGRLLTITYPDGSLASYTYDAANLKSVSRGNQEHIYKEYALNGSLLHENNTQYSYTPKQQLQSIIHPKYNQQQITYDSVGNLISFNINNKTHTFTYDQTYQLSEEKGNIHETYSYDSLYNRTKKAQEDCSYNALNQRGDESYDLAGNLIEYHQKSLKYDALDRLIQADDTNYQYDSFNRRMTKTDSKKNRVSFFYHDQNELGSYKNNKLIDLRVLGRKQESEAGATVFLEIHGKTYTPLHDHQGNITMLFDLTNKPIESYYYSAFGEQLNLAKLSPWRFQGKRVDPETGLVNFGRRYYAPDRGRWLTPDPVGFEGGPNLYAYVSNSPLTHFDAYGLILIPAIAELLAAKQVGGNRIYDVTNNQSIDRTKYSQSSNSIGFNELFMNTFCKGEVCLKEVGEFRRPNKGIGYSNGVWNQSLKEGEQSAEILSKMSGGHKVDLVYNPSCGKLQDIERYAMSRLSQKATPTVVGLIHNWEKFAQHSAPDATYLQILHSEGVSNGKHALLCVSPELRKRIKIIAVAPSVYIDPSLCREVTHYVSKGDPVTYLDPIGRRKFASTVRTIENPIWKGILNHPIQSGVYNQYLQEDMTEYLKQ